MRAAATAAAALLTMASPALAQTWSAEATIGRLDFDAAAASAPAATSVGLGLRYDSHRSWLGLSSGVPLGEEDPLWGAAEAGTRLSAPLGRFTLGVDLSAQGFLQRYEAPAEDPTGGILDGPGNGKGPFGGDDPLTGGRGGLTGVGFAGQVMPAGAISFGAAELRARTGYSYYHGSLDTASVSRGVLVSDARLTLTATPRLALMAEASRYGTDDGTHAFAGGTVFLGHARGGVWGSVGAWLGDDAAAEGVPWSAGASLRVTDRAELTATARQDTFDPLYGSVPRRTWGVGLRVALSRPASAAPPVPAAYAGGRATIALDADDAPGRPRIAGDFNGWTPAPMTRDGERWTATMPLEPGVYEFAFVAADGTWFVPESTPGRKSDGMGGHVAVLVVEEVD